MNVLDTILQLARKDLALFFRDRVALLLALVLPIALATVFGSAMSSMSGGGGGDAPRIEILFQDDDDSEASRAILAGLESSRGLRPVVVADDAREQVANGDAAAALVVPAGYGAALEAGEVPELALLRDPSRSIAQQVIAGNLMPILIEAVGQRLGAGLMTKFLGDIGFPQAGLGRAEAVLASSWEQMDALVAELEDDGAFAESETETESETGSGFDFLNDVPRLLGVVAEDVAGAEPDGPPRSAGGSHAVAAMAVMMLMFSLVAAGGTLLEEHEGGTLQRLLLAPTAGGAILWGKAVSLGAIGALQLAVLFAYGAVAFDVPVLERPVALVVTSGGVLLASAGLGLLFAVVSRSRKQLEGLSTLVILLMSAVGGAWFPREIAPEWFQLAGRFTVTAYAMDAFHGILWYGKGLVASGDRGGVGLDVAVLYAIGAVLLTLSARLFHRRYRRP